jgi:hypothetical protein
MPFRWVGYNADANHGRGNHLHLSWRHTPAKRGRPAAVVWRLNLRSPKAPKVASLSSLAARSNFRLGRKPKHTSGLRSPSPCSGAAALTPIFKAAARAFGLRWTVLAGLTEVESRTDPGPPPSAAQILRPARATQEALWANAGIERDRAGLQTLLSDPHPLARLVARCALLREETRGSHRRSDFPETDPALDGRHAVVRGEQDPVSEPWS